MKNLQRWAQFSFLVENFVTLSGPSLARSGGNMTMMLFNSKGIEKFLKLLLKQGKKEKLEKKFLCCLKTLDFYLLFECFYRLEVPFRFYRTKKQIGRRSFLYYNSLVYVKEKMQLEVAVSQLFKLFIFLQGNKSFSEIIFLNLIRNFIEKKGGFIYEQSFLLKKKVLSVKGLKHYR